MSQRDRPGRGARRAAPSARPRSRAAHPVWAWAATAAAGLAVAALVVWSPWRGHAPDRSAPPAASSVERLDLRAAYAEAARLYEARRDLESVPYFRRVLALVPAPSRNLHLQLTDALERAALQSRTDGPLPATRSSVERVALVREALAQLDQAERLSRTPRELAEVRAWRANLMRVWGFPWETLQALRAAGEADPSWSAVVGSAGLYARRVRYPAESIPGIDDDVILRDAP